MNQKRYTSSDGSSSASKFGQMIGEMFESVVVEFINEYLARQHPEFELLKADEGKIRTTLDMLGGSSRQMDNIVALKNSKDPVALLETKWLKDARHHNDKGAWMLQLREVRKKYPTIRGAVAILAGYWTEGVGVLLMGEGQIKMVLVATDEEVYQTLQQPLNDFLRSNSFDLDPVKMRLRYPRPWDLANFLIDLENKDKFREIAKSWLLFVRDEQENIKGEDLIKRAVDDLLSPLPDNPKILKFEIGLQIDTGNMIYEELSDIESAMDFLKRYFQNSEEILNRITPRADKSDD